MRKLYLLFSILLPLMAMSQSNPPDFKFGKVIVKALHFNKGAQQYSDTGLVKTFGDSLFGAYRFIDGNAQFSFGAEDIGITGEHFTTFFNYGSTRLNFENTEYGWHMYAADTNSNKYSKLNIQNDGTMPYWKLSIDHSGGSESTIYGDTNAIDLTADSITFNGKVKINNGTQGAGKVLMSDANGDCVFSTPSAARDTSFNHIVANRRNRLDTVFRNINLISNTNLFPKGTYFTVYPGTYTATVNIARDSCTLDCKNNVIINKTNPGALFHFTGPNGNFNLLGLATINTVDTLFVFDSTPFVVNGNIAIEAKKLKTTAADCIYINCWYMPNVRIRADIACSGGRGIYMYQVYGSSPIPNVTIDDYSEGISSSAGSAIVANVYYGYRTTIKANLISTSTADNALVGTGIYRTDADITGINAISINGGTYNGNITGNVNCAGIPDGYGITMNMTFNGSITNSTIIGSGTINSVCTNCSFQIAYYGNLVVNGKVTNDVNFWITRPALINPCAYYYAGDGVVFNNEVKLSNNNTLVYVLYLGGYASYGVSATFNAPLTMIGNYTYSPQLNSINLIKINSDYINKGTTTINEMIAMYDGALQIGANARIVNNSTEATSKCIKTYAHPYGAGISYIYTYGGIVTGKGTTNIESTNNLKVYNYQNYFNNKARTTSGIGTITEQITGGGTEIIDVDVQ